MNRRDPDVDTPRRLALDDERCVCGRRADCVYRLSDGTEVPWCGKDDRDIKAELEALERGRKNVKAWGPHGARRRLSWLVALTFIVVVIAGAGDRADAASGRCPQYEHLLAARNMPVATFSRIMFRESGCRPGVRSRTRDTGLLQINDVNHRWLSRRLGVRVTVAWLRNPVNNIVAADELYEVFGTRPWRA
jgi:Transglycosylase SLT domain